MPNAAAVVAGNNASGNGGSATGANAAVVAGDNMPGGGGGVSATVKILPVEDR